MRKTENGNIMFATHQHRAVLHLLVAITRLVVVRDVNLYAVAYSY
jgi:hypothetical protein